MTWVLRSDSVSSIVILPGEGNCANRHKTSSSECLQWALLECYTNGARTRSIYFWSGRVCAGADALGKLDRRGEFESLPPADERLDHRGHQLGAEGVVAARLVEDGAVVGFDAVGVTFSWAADCCDIQRTRASEIRCCGEVSC